MPKCNECGNEELFVSFHTDATMTKYEGNKEIDSWSVGYTEADIPNECGECQSQDIGWR